MIKIVRLLPIFFFVSLLSTGVAQNQQLTGARLLSQTHPDSALIILKKLHAQAIAKNDAAAEGICLQQMGQICYNQGHYAQALDFYLHADKIFSAENNKGLLAANMGQMGVLYYYNKQLNKSRALYNK